MHTYYEDILSRITEPPKWFDEHAVPRFCPFTPEEVANIYAEQVCLLLIECQSCTQPFEVALSWSNHPVEPTREIDGVTLDRLIETHQIHYGDPPNVECCLSGPSMNSVPKRVLQFCQKNRSADTSYRWDRVPALEIEIKPAWMEDQDDT